MSQYNPKRKNDRSAAAPWLLATGAAALGGSWILYSQLAIDHDVPLPDAIPAERRRFYSQTAGNVSYYVDEGGSPETPLLLIHSVNAAASAYEMRPLFEHYRGRRPVYALDLPGYGFSDRLDVDYRPQLFEDAIADLVATQIGRPVDAVALSLGSEFLARAALANPGRYRSLALISPTGLRESGRGDAPRADDGGSSQLVHRLLAFPLWGRALFDLIATRRSIAFYLQKSFVGDVTPGFVDYAYVTAHQPGAHHAPLHFLSGGLFTRNAAQIVYQNVTVPALAIYDQDPFTSFELLPALVEHQRNWQSVRLTPQRGLPHFERLPETAAVLDRFWLEAAA